ncbi:MAG: HAMP domain-containing histidine kinase [Caldilinea sp.]|nr:HAMP domain-containing histidine kinase [Caldilinea sp.]MDW8441580.1 HAMP domain-containing sensor histidine kinase [Caldilineaceae bacterium]
MDTVFDPMKMIRWRESSLRTRLTVLYVGLLTLLLVGLGALLYFDVRTFLVTSTAVRLRAQAKPVIERWLAEAPLDAAGVPSLRPIADHLARDLTSRDTTALIIDHSGALLANGRRLPEEPLPAPVDAERMALALAGENEITYAVMVDDQHTMVLLIPLRPQPGDPTILGVAQLSTPLTVVDQILWREQRLIIVGSVLTILLGMAGSFWLTSSALRPLRRMTDACRRIAAGDLSERVNLPHQQNVETKDEVAQLASAFNDMITRIENTFAVQQRFIADAAHELRTPLTAIKGSLEVLLRGSQDDPANAKLLIRAMYSEAERLSRLAEQLLDLTRLQNGMILHRAPIDLGRWLQEEWMPQAHLLARDRRLELQPGEPATIYADPDALKQVLFNLLDNAVQHTMQDGKIQIGWATAHSIVKLWVADDGEGIAPEDLPHIFAPFYRGDRSRSRLRGGAGLGLTIVQSIVHAHGGRVQVSGTPGKGTQVTFTLECIQSSWQG